MTGWLSVIGLGDDGLAGLAPAARTLIDGAALIVGGERHLALLGPTRAERRTWRTPLSATVAEIAAMRGRPVVVLASGDPMWFGVGVTLARHFPPPETLIIPVAGAFALAAARLGWPIAECETLTVHGRSLDLVSLHLYPGAKLLVLSEDGTTPAKLAGLLTARGWGESAMSVLAHMGGPAESRIDGTAADWSTPVCPDLNTVAIICFAGPDAQVIGRTGLPDDAFEHDGQLTKREVRAATLAALVPLPGQLLWDVGTGNGSVAIEWMRAARGARAVAVERDPARSQRSARNAARLGVPGLRIVEGSAPAALAGLDDPDAVFIGGGLSDPAILRQCWEALRRGGRLVANAVTTEGEAALFDAQRNCGGALVRVAISRAEPVGRRLGWRPLMPVTQWQATKR